jgi:hypothetical protein
MGMKKALKILFSLVLLGFSTVRPMEYIRNIFKSLAEGAFWVSLDENSDDQSDSDSSLKSVNSPFAEQRAALSRVVDDSSSDGSDVDDCVREIYKKKQRKIAQKKNMEMLLERIIQRYNLSSDSLDSSTYTLFLKDRAHLFPTLLEEDTWWNYDSEEMVTARFCVTEKSIIGHSKLFNKIDIVKVSIGGETYERIISPTEPLKDEIQGILARKSEAQLLDC